MQGRALTDQPPPTAKVQFETVFRRQSPLVIYAGRVRDVLRHLSLTGPDDLGFRVIGPLRPPATLIVVLGPTRTRTQCAATRSSADDRGTGSRQAGRAWAARATPRRRRDGSDRRPRLDHPAAAVSRAGAQHTAVQRDPLPHGTEPWPPSRGLPAGAAGSSTPAGLTSRSCSSARSALGLAHSGQRCAMSRHGHAMARRAVWRMGLVGPCRHGPARLA